MPDNTSIEDRLATPAIPRFNIPSVKTREDFHGHRVTVERATCDESSVSLHRLLTLLGPSLLKLMSWSDDHAEEETGEKMSPLAALMDMDLTADGVKSFFLAHALPLLKDRFSNLSTHDLLFHVDNLLVGHLTVADVRIKTRADLDATGISVIQMLPLLFDVLEVNYFPTLAGPSTSSGDESEPARAERVVKVVSQNLATAQARKKSSTKGGKRRGGQSVRTRKS